MNWICDTCGHEVPPGETHICGTPYQGYRYVHPPQPKYDRLVVGQGKRVAYDKHGREVDEQTGKVILQASADVEEVPLPASPVKRPRGRPRKVTHGD